MTTGLAFALMGGIEVPNEFTCPITLELMIWPTVSKYGHTFEKHAILAWLKRGSSCPLSRQQLSAADLQPNYSLRQEIQQWQEYRETSILGPPSSAPASLSYIDSHNRQFRPLHDYRGEYVARLRKGILSARPSIATNREEGFRSRKSVLILWDTKNLEVLLDEYDHLESQTDEHIEYSQNICEGQTHRVNNL
jgi:U-box domain